MKLGLTFLALLFVSINWAQSAHSLSGKVVDSETGKPLVFANLIFNNDNSLGTITDIDGEFSYSSDVELKSITSSYLGYEKKTRYIRNAENIEIRMDKVSETLAKVIIKSDENPGKKIIEKVIAHKTENDPKNINTFIYRSHSKTIFSAEPVTLEDTVELDKDHYIFLMENISETKFKKPNLSEKTILASKVSGFKNISFPIIARQLQPFSFYEKNVKLLDDLYLNPISDLGLEKYHFKLEDKLYKNSDTIFTISFRPLENKNIAGLNGVVNINSNNYGIQSIRATPDEVGKMRFTIKQEYTFLKNRWFPKQLNYRLEFNDYPSENDQLFVESKIYIDSIRFDKPIRSKDFSFKKIKSDPKATSRDSVYWQKHRVKGLSQSELNTYRIIDSIGEKHNFSKYLNLMKKIPESKLQIGSFDFDLSQTFIYNKYEGLRVGTGVYTNENFLEKFVFGGFLGYGIKDKDWKYGASAQYEFTPERGYLKIGYKNTLTEVGFNGINREYKELLDFRRYIGYRFDKIEEYDVSIGYDIFRNLNSKVSLNKREIQPKFNYDVENNDHFDNTYDMSSIAITLNFADLNSSANLGTYLEENSYNSFNASLFYEKGISNLFKSDFSFNKLEANVRQSFYTSGLGKTSYRIEGGYIDDVLPYGQLFTGEGGYDKNFPLVMENSFQTVYPYEFLSDRYVNLYFAHNFESLLFKTKFIQPEIILHHNMGWGKLSKENKERQQFINYATKENVFTELGLELNHLLKINYLNLGYLNFGVAGFYRYGAYSLSNFKDNMKIKLTFDFTFK